MTIGKKTLLVLSLIIMLAFLATACKSQDSQQSSQSTSGQQAAETSLFVSIMSMTSPVKASGSPATLFARTKPGVACNIKVGYQGGAGEANSLVQKQAGDNGVVFWSWTVDSSATPGTYQVTVTATDTNGKTASAQKTIEIKPADCKK